MGGTLTFPMAADRSRRLSRQYVLGDLLVDSTFPELAAQLDPDATVLANLGRLSQLLELLGERFPPAWRVLSGFRDARLNDACREAGLPASVRSLHLSGCAADVEPGDDALDLEEVFEWLRDHADEIALHEAVYYPKKGFIHVAVVDTDAPSPKRILMRM